MRRITVSLTLTALVALTSSVAVTTQAPGAVARSRHPLVTPAQYERWQTELTNWRRWGPDDQLGALNLITPAKRKQAAALVTEGTTVSLASNAATSGAPDVPCPVQWAMVSASQTAATDRIAYPCIHGAGTTHIDSLAHIFFNGKMWNGYPVDGNVSREKGATRNSVLNMKNGIVTRAVLYDIPSLKGVPYLEPGTRIFPEDLEAWEKKTGLKVGSGDALLLRWGRWARGAKMGPWNTDEA
jgi:hypothetical protein